MKQPPALRLSEQCNSYSSQRSDEPKQEPIEEYQSQVASPPDRLANAQNTSRCNQLLGSHRGEDAHKTPKADTGFRRPRHDGIASTNIRHSIPSLVQSILMGLERPEWPDVNSVLGKQVPVSPFSTRQPATLAAPDWAVYCLLSKISRTKRF